MALVPPLDPPPIALVREPGADDGVEQFGVPISELLAADIDPAQWLVQSYVLEGSIAVLAGPPNSGKTLLALDWAVQCVAAGKRVFIVENEGGLHGLQKRLRRACCAAGLDKLPAHFAYRRNLQLSLANPAHVKKFAKHLEFYDLIILDSLAALWPGLNENDPEHMSLVAEALKNLVEATGAAVIGIHHTTKAAWKPGEKPGMGDLRGHSSLVGRIDTAMICKPLERAAGVVRFELHLVKQRDEDWIPPKSVEIQMTGDAATVTSEPLGGGLTNSREDHRSREIEQAILFALGDDVKEAISGNAICEKVKKSKTDVLNAIKRLFSRQMITQDWTGKYYRVKVSNEPQPSDPGNHKRSTPSRYRPYQPPGDDDP